MSETFIPKEALYKKVRTFEVGGREIDVSENNHGLVDLNDLNTLAEASRIGEATQPKRVLLVDFKTSRRMPDNQDYTFQNFPNLGVHRIAGYLSGYNIPVSIIRYSELKDDPERLQQVLEANDVIGVSNLTNQVEDAYTFCRGVKAQFGDDKLVVGGGEHYLAYDEILSDPEGTGVDVCCIGQGELPMLSLALGKEVEEVGSLAYRSEVDSEHISIVKNRSFQRLIDGADPSQEDNLEILNTREATPFSEEEAKGLAPFNELNDLSNFKFDGTFVTQTGSGCLYGCDFCPSKKFFGPGFKPNIGVARQEVLSFKQAFPEKQEVFMSFADTMINPSIEHLRNIIDFMKEVNSESGPKISWFGYMSAPRLEKNESLEQWREKWDAILSDMAEDGCIMAGVGVEEVIYDRNKIYHKGQDIDTASEFIDLIGKHMMTRALLMLGGPDHFQIDRTKTLKAKEELDTKYKSDGQLIKDEILEYMKAHPQALYRFSIWTLMYGTDDFYKYEDCIDGDTSDPATLKNLDQMHSTIDPEKMYAHIERDTGVTIPQDKKWVKDKEVWFELMDEIMGEYLQSEEHLAYLETLREKNTGQNKGLLYEIALKFKDNALAQIERNKQKRIQGENKDLS